MCVWSLFACFLYISALDVGVRMCTAVALRWGVCVCFAHVVCHNAKWICCFCIVFLNLALLGCCVCVPVCWWRVHWGDCVKLCEGWGGSVRVERVMGWWCEGGSVGAVDQYESEGILNMGVYGVMIVKHH